MTIVYKWSGVAHECHLIVNFAEEEMYQHFTFNETESALVCKL